MLAELHFTKWLFHVKMCTNSAEANSASDGNVKSPH